MTQTNVRVFLRKFEASKFSLTELFPLFACLAWGTSYSRPCEPSPNYADTQIQGTQQRARVQFTGYWDPSSSTSQTRFYHLLRLDIKKYQQSHQTGRDCCSTFTFVAPSILGWIDNFVANMIMTHKKQKYPPKNN